jgi:hypothetical protein
MLRKTESLSTRGFAARRSFFEGFGTIAGGVFSSSLSHRIELNYGVTRLAVPSNRIPGFTNDFLCPPFGNPERARSVPHGGGTAVIDSDRSVHEFSINLRPRARFTLVRSASVVLFLLQIARLRDFFQEIWFQITNKILDLSQPLT